MSWIGKLLGSATGSSIAEPVEAIGNAVDKVFTSKDEKLMHQEILERLKQRPSEIMQEVNKLEAQHRTVFVAGWRPFVGWVCGLSLFYNFMMRDLFSWALALYDKDITPPPALQMEHLMTVLLGMLGLGVYRTFEKTKGVAK